MVRGGGIVKKSTVIRETKRDRIFLGILLAVSLIILVIEIYPLIYVVSASFSSSSRLRFSFGSLL